MAVDVSKLKRYLTAVEDNHRWAGFDARPNDIFICTPPKCGTTWTQTIVASLLWPAGDQPDDIMALSPWVDAKFMPVDALDARLRAQPHRRFIKTHTPADGIPWFDDAKYIVVARDGRDAFMSMCNHMERMSADAKAGLNAQVKDNPDVMLLPTSIVPAGKRRALRSAARSPHVCREVIGILRKSLSVRTPSGAMPAARNRSR